MLGSLCLLEGLAQVLVGYLRSPGDPLIPIYAQVPALGGWRWGSALCDFAAGLLLLHGGIDGLRRRALARVVLRFGTGILVVQWSIDLALWGGWCFDAFGTVRSARFYYTSPGVFPTYEPYEVVFVRAHIIAELVVSTLVLLTWWLLIWRIGRSRPRRSNQADEAPGRPVPVVSPDEVAQPVSSAPPKLSYSSPHPRLARPALLAHPVLVRTLFQAGLALGLLNGLTDLSTLLNFAGSATGGGLVTPSRLLSSSTSTISLGFHILGVAAAFTVTIGCALGLLGQTAPARITLFVGLTATLLLQLAELDQNLSFAMFRMLQGHERWHVPASVVAVFLRRQIYAVICFVAFARAPISRLRGD